MQVDQDTLNEIGGYLSKNGLKLALVESMTAGYFSSVWSLQVDSGDYLEGAIVAFSRELKEDLLQVPPDLIDGFTAESLIVTESLVEGLKRLVLADVYIGVTGLAYEGREEHPTAKKGDVFLVIYYNNQYSYFPLKARHKNAADVYISAFNQSLGHLKRCLNGIRNGTI